MQKTRHIATKTKAELIEETTHLHQQLAKLQKTQESLSKSALVSLRREREISDILSALSHGIVLVDVKTAVIKASNPAMLATIGLSEDHVIGKKYTEFLPDQKNDSEHALVDAGGRKIPVMKSTVQINLHGRDYVIISCIDISERKKMEKERERLITELQNTIAQVKTLKGLIPICCECHKIRTDKDYWQTVESYIETHSEAKFTHGYCRECADKVIRQIENEHVDA